MKILRKIFGLNSTSRKIKKQEIGDGYVYTEFEYEPIIPEFQGDYAKTIFLYAHKKINPIKKDEDYQKYLLYECGINNPSKYHKELIKEGYFVESTLDGKLNYLNIQELKLLLKKNNLESNGKKEFLVKRILENIDTILVENELKQSLYVLSKKGIDFLNDHFDYIVIHNNKSSGLDWKLYE